jgi:hypothetical protein
MYEVVDENVERMLIPDRYVHEHARMTDGAVIYVETTALEANGTESRELWRVECISAELGLYFTEASDPEFARAELREHGAAVPA